MTDTNTGEQKTPARSNRRDDILQTLAQMLESSAGNKITTAALAREVGVSEAALYRHFPSKAKMFDALIDFIEDTLFSRISKILESPVETTRKCAAIAELLLQFAERNPGMCRILTGDALVGEKDRLGQRSAQIMSRVETQLKQLLRQAELGENLRTSQPVAICANHICAFADGKILQYVRSNFSEKPSQALDLHWQLLENSLFNQ